MGYITFHRNTAGQHDMHKLSFWINGACVTYIGTLADCESVAQTFSAAEMLVIEPV